MRRCQYFDDPEVGFDDRCKAAASVYTDDLQAVHFLCREHHEEALLWNDFEFEEVAT